MVDDSKNGKLISHFDVADRFVTQVRRAFEGSGPKPVFSVRQQPVRKKWVLGKFKRLEMDIMPQIFYPVPKMGNFLSLPFQRLVNALLRENPVVLSGVSNLRFKLEDGQYVKISNVHWQVEVYKLRKLEMDDKGVIAITQFYARSK